MSKRNIEAGSSGAEIVPAVTPGLGLDVVANQLVEAARTEGIALTGDGGLLPALLKRVLETGLNVELTDHLGYEPNSPAGRNSGNSRNGTFDKTVTTEIGPIDLQVPRDRAGTFDPQLVPHGERRFDGLTDQIISLYGKGMTTGEIAAHLEEIFDTNISKATISRVTDAIVADMEAWQSRPLEPTWFPMVVANPERQGFACRDMRGTKVHRKSRFAISN